MDYLDEMYDRQENPKFTFDTTEEEMPSELAEV